VEGEGGGGAGGRDDPMYAHMNKWINKQKKSMLYLFSSPMANISFELDQVVIKTAS
jgi:hypothetical protein